MKCPQCGNDLKVSNTAEWTVDDGRPVLAVTSCCGKGVYLIPVRTFVAEAYTGERTEDDWGNPLKK